MAATNAIWPPSTAATSPLVSAEPHPWLPAQPKDDILGGYKRRLAAIDRRNFAVDGLASCKAAGLHGGLTHGKSIQPHHSLLQARAAATLVLPASTAMRHPPKSAEKSNSRWKCKTLICDFLPVRR